MMFLASTMRPSSVHGERLVDRKLLQFDLLVLVRKKALPSGLERDVIDPAAQPSSRFGETELFEIGNT
jgi:hypothetical protein